MKQVQYIFLHFLLAGLTVSISLAQLDNTQTNSKSGTTSAQFLKIPFDAVGPSMGGASVSMPGNLGSVFWNAAGLSNLDRIEVAFINSNWIAETQLQHIGIGIPIRNFGVLGISVTQLSVPKDIVRTISKPEGTGEFWEASDMAIQLSYAKKLTDRFSIGGNFKFIQQKIWHTSATSIAGDLGVLFITPFAGTRIGASLSNYGNDMSLSGRDQKLSVDPDPNNQGNVEFVNALYETESFPLPLLFRVGISNELVKTNLFRITFGLDAIHPNDNNESVNTGVEIAMGETIFLRTGFASLFKGNSEEAISFGGGLKTRLWRSSARLKVDYCFQNYGRLENLQRISLGIVF